MARAVGLSEGEGDGEGVHSVEAIPVYAQQ